MSKISNFISQLQGDNGNWISTQDGLCSLTQDYFNSLFSINRLSSSSNLSFISHRVSNDDNALLTAPFSLDEFKRAIMQMHPDKALGQMTLI